MTAPGAYRPLEPGRRPGGRPSVAPAYRVLVHRKYRDHYLELVERVGLQQAQQFWDHIAHTPGQPSPIAQICILRGQRACLTARDGPERCTMNSQGAARADYQFHNAYTTEVGRGPARRGRYSYSGLLKSLIEEVSLLGE